MARNKPSVVGFKDEAPLVKRVAKLLDVKPSFVRQGKYRAGEMKLVGPAKPAREAVVAACVTESPESLLRVLSLAHELRHAGAKHLTLLAPWIAYGRQDRATHPGEEPMGLMVGKLLSSMFDRIVTLDAHSPAFVESFKGRLVNVLPWMALQAGGVDLVAAPDHGAIERASLAADALGVPFIVVEKKRSGKKTTAKLQPGTRVKGAHILMVDDMADSGGTLKAAARALKKAGASRVEAVVSHAFDASVLRKALALETESVKAYYDHDKEPTEVALALLTRGLSG